MTWASASAACFDRQPQRQVPALVPLGSGQCLIRARVAHDGFPSSQSGIGLCATSGSARCRCLALGSGSDRAGAVGLVERVLLVALLLPRRAAGPGRGAAALLPAVPEWSRLAACEDSGVAIVGTVKLVLALYCRFRDLIHEAARFGVVGLAALAVTDGGANLLHYDAGVDKFSAVAIATIVATVLSFVASRYWTFRHRDRRGARKETVLFFLVNGVGVAISEGCIGFASALGLTGKISYNVALNGGIALATLFRYWSYRRWVWPAAAAASGRTGPAGSRLTAKETLRQLPAGELAKFSVVGVFALVCGNGAAFLLHARSGAVTAGIRCRRDRRGDGHLLWR